MRSGVKFLFFLVLVLGRMQIAAAQESKELDFADVEALQPFWQSKPALMKEIRENRKVVVSVTEQDGDNWQFKGIGQIDAPIDSCWRQAHEVQKLALVSKYIKGLKYAESEGKLEFRLAVLGKEIEIKSYLKYLPDQKKILLSVLEGPYQGLRGIIFFKDIERLKTDSIFFAKYQKKSSIVPDWLFSFTIEAVMHHVASDLREMVERDYRVTGK